MLVADAAEGGRLAAALTAESMSVQLASDQQSVDELLRLSRPAAAVVDIDLPLGVAIVPALAATRIHCALIGSNLAALRQFQSLVPTLLEKPVGLRAFTRTVDGLLGRR
ncbi:MAG: hypothetical protein IT337_18280 [Thermomicrobiales bacterium]|nr:hypothetical protein [Thermomicrobiales bacterium]